VTLSTEDQLDIQQLYARYNHAIDAGNGDAWGACFTPDGTFTSGSGNFAGTEALAGFAKGFGERMKARHWTNNLVVESQGEDAKGTCYLLLFKLTPGEKPPAALLTSAIYNDVLTKAGGEWKFASRAVTPDA